MRSTWRENDSNADHPYCYATAAVADAGTETDWTRRSVHSLTIADSNGDSVSLANTSTWNATAGSTNVGPVELAVSGLYNRTDLPGQSSS